MEAESGEYVETLVEECEDGSISSCNELEEIADYLEGFVMIFKIRREYKVFDYIVEECFDGDEEACEELDNNILSDVDYYYEERERRIEEYNELRGML